MLQKNINGKCVVMYGIELSTAYDIYEGTVATCEVFSPTNHEGQEIRSRRKEFLTERGNSIHSPGFV